MVRVLLRRLQLTDRADLTLAGAYTVRVGGEDLMALPENAQVTDPIEGRSASHVAPAEWRLNACRKFCDLANALAVGVCGVHLHCTVAIRDERNAFSVGGKARRILRLVSTDELARRLRTVRGHGPDIRIPSAGIDCCCRPCEQDLFAVRRKVGVAYTYGTNQVIDRHRPFCLSK